MTHDDTPIETSEADARPWRGEVPATDPAPARWYCLSRIGMATLCLDEADAKRTAAAEDDLHPLNGPHRAVRLVEASQPATAPVVPAGWQLVPVEPTPEMLAADVETSEFVGIDDARILWAAMLAAAPAAPVVQPRQVAWGVFAKLDGEWSLQWPPRMTYAVAQDDCSAYKSGTETKVLPLLACITTGDTGSAA